MIFFIQLSEDCNGYLCKKTWVNKSISFLFKIAFSDTKISFEKEIFKTCIAEKSNLGRFYLRVKFCIHLQKEY